MTQSNQLLKLLGISFGIAATIGGTIGAGILRKPGAIAAQLGDPWIILLVWAAVGVYAFLGVLCAIELGVSIPQAGSWYVYARRAFGNYCGFVTGITSWFGTMSALSFGAYTMSEYLNILAPQTIPWTLWIAVSILFILCLFHLTGTKSGGKSQEILTFLKAIGLFAFIGLCFMFGENAQYSSDTTLALQNLNAKAQTPTLILGIITALQAVFYTFDGWHTAACFSEENTNPAHNLPKSMIIGVITIIAIYLLVNAAILYVLPMEILMQSKLAAADAVLLIFGAQSAKWVTLFLMISILGLLNTQIMIAPRVIFSMSRDGLFFKAAQKINAGGTPAIALPLTTIGSMLLIISGKSLCAILSDIATFFFVIGYMAGFASLIKLRKTEPHLPRSFKVPLYPYIPYILLAISLLFLIEASIQDMKSSQFALLILLLSYPLYRLQQWLGKRGDYQYA